MSTKRFCDQCGIEIPEHRLYSFGSHGVIKVESTSYEALEGEFHEPACVVKHWLSIPGMRLVVERELAVVVAEIATE